VGHLAKGVAGNPISRPAGSCDPAPDVESSESQPHQYERKKAGNNQEADHPFALEAVAREKGKGQSDELGRHDHKRVNPYPLGGGFQVAARTRRKKQAAKNCDKQGPIRAFLCPNEGTERKASDQKVCQYAKNETASLCHYVRSSVVTPQEGQER
jgi:hypothetical protein